MRTVQTILLKLICVALLAAGVVLFFYPIGQVYQLAATYLPDWDWLRRLVAILVGLIAFWGLIPLPRRRYTGKTLTLPDAEGITTIRLGSIEKTLEGELAKQPEVKRIAIHIEPADDERRVRITADIVLKKPPATVTRDVAAGLKTYIAQQAREILGREEVVGVDLNIERIVVERRRGEVVEEAPPLLKETPLREGPIEPGEIPSVSESPRFDLETPLPFSVPPTARGVADSEQEPSGPRQQDRPLDSGGC